MNMKYGINLTSKLTLEQGGQITHAIKILDKKYQKLNRGMPQS
jgi:hypothetical protein